MPLSQDDPSLDYDGSWGDASKDWPKISFPTEEEAELAYIIAWRDAKVPYGSYVLVGQDLRLETPELKQLVETYVAASRKPSIDLFERMVGKTIKRVQWNKIQADKPAYIAFIEFTDGCILTVNSEKPMELIGDGEWTYKAPIT